jgi:tetratricopeptide (TPR) repeat protein
MNSLGSKLKAARLARGLTQEALAGGVATKGYVSLVEHDRLTPSLPKLRLLADRLGQPLSHFVREPVPTDPTYLLRTIELAVKANEPKRALGMVREALPLPLTANQRADLHRLWGMASWSLGRKPRALANLYKAAALAPPDDPQLSAAVYAEIGALLGSDERFSASMEASLRALDWLGKSRQDDPDLRARLLTNLANASYRLGQPEEAIAYLQKALRAATDAESLLRLANAHMALGITARAAGDLEKAIKHCDRALSIHQRIGQRKIANQILSNLGDAYRKLDGIRPSVSDRLASPMTSPRLRLPPRSWLGTRSRKTTSRRPSTWRVKARLRRQRLTTTSTRPRRLLSRVVPRTDSARRLRPMVCSSRHSACCCSDRPMPSWPR